MDYLPGSITHADALEESFRAILETLADTDVLSHPTSPSIFIVYAHDNEKEGIAANAGCVRKLIEWLGVIRSQVLSDKSPLPLWSNRKEGSAPIRNILDNQFCVLPKRSDFSGNATISSVDKVIVCGSGLLKRYYNDAFTSSYINAIESLYIEGQTQTAGKDVLESKVRSIVEGNCQHPAFHHVLTELAFLKLRRVHSRNGDHGIIPVALDKDLMTYLPFLENSDLVLKLKSFEEVDLHRLFFQLLRQLYTEAQPFISRFESCYKAVIERLGKGTVVAREKLERIVYSEIHAAVVYLKQLDGAALRNVNRQNLFQSVLSRLCEIPQISGYEERRRRVLSTLSTLPYLDRKNRNLERMQGTCEWFTNHRLFRNWQDNTTAGLLWVSADPGCGKSVLARHLVDNVLPTTSTRSTCYFFFKDDFEDQKNLESAMRCLLHQLFVQRPDLLSDEVLERFDQDSQLLDSFASLWYILTSVASHKDAGEIICVMDALDECEEEGRSCLASTLSDFYKKEESKSLKFLLTSRPYRDIQYELQTLQNQRPTIHLSGENEEEVRKISREIDIVIKARVKDTSARLELECEEEQLLHDELTSSLHRTYLWVYLVFDVINNSVGITKEQLRTSIRTLPRTVKEAYEKILGRSKNIGKARRLLHIVVAADRPLTSQEIATALRVTEYSTYHELELDLEPDDRFRKTIRELCGLFVTIVDSKVYLLHQTAREFLVWEPSNIALPTTQWQNSFRPTESHGLLAEICIHHLCLPDINISKGGDITIFVEYAAKNWAAHFRKTDDTHQEKLVCRAQQLCSGSSQRCRQWLEFHMDMAQDPFPDGFTDLMIASYVGLETLVCLLLKKKKQNINVRDETHGRSALSWACESGNIKVVKILLNCMAKSLYNFFSRRIRAIDLEDKHGWTPLRYAVSLGHDEIAKLLLEKGADLGTRKDDNVLLWFAIYRGRKDMVQLLLKKGADPNAPNQSGGTPLYMAAYGGQTSIVELLFENGANINAPNQFGETLLLAAIRKKRKDMV